MGQVYADNKNYELAEYNFFAALSYENREDVKLSLFNIYYAQNEYNKAYAVAKDINYLPEVREKLKSMYYNQEDYNLYIKIILRQGKEIIADKRPITSRRKLSVGDTFTLVQAQTIIFDNKTGEKLTTKRTTSTLSKLLSLLFI